MSTQVAVSWKIHPAIGIARVGNSASDFILAPQADGQGAPSSLARRAVDETDGMPMAQLKREAALFRIYAYDREDNCLGEIAPGSVRQVEWTVRVANTKASAPKIGFQRKNGRGRVPPRNKTVPAAERWKLEIRPQPRTLCGPNQRAAFDDGRFMEVPVSLGEIRTDAASRLIVLGGAGKAGTADATRRLRNCTDNDFWYDDVSDGPVSATVTLADGRLVHPEPAWVITAPPNFAPDLRSVATAYDVLIDHAINRNVRPLPQRPSFTRDIQPILRRIAAMQWLNQRALASFGSATTGIDLLESLDLLSRNDTAAHEARAAVFVEICGHDAIGRTAADGGAPGDITPADRWLRLTGTQLALLRLWARGEFEPDASDTGAQPAAGQDMLDRTSLEASAAGVVFCDTAPPDVFLPGEALRLDPGKISAGGLTRAMPCPWHADFLQASTPWPVALRPDEIMTEETFAALQSLDQEISALDAGEDLEDQRRTLQDRRSALWQNRTPWSRGLPAETPACMERLVKEWQHLGLIRANRPDGPAFVLGHATCFVETERNRCLGTMGDYFHRLLNIETNRWFTRKALEIAEQTLHDAKFAIHPNYAPFAYTPEAFDTRMDRIYADLVDGTMYQPVPWESGDIHWEAEIDHDEDGEPVYATRQFRVGQFSDAALKERFRQFAPLNLTDGAWLQNILGATPADGVRSRLFNIWVDEAGGGRPELNHSNVYDALMRSLNLYLPPVTSREFVEIDFVASAFESTVFQLSLGMFPTRFLPELLGLTLFVEWEATPTMLPTANMMADRQIDPQFYRMHAAIDNIHSGHGAIAKEAVKLYLHAKLQEGGNAAVQEHWQRIWRGYVAWATLGNGADDVVEQMLIVDKKQIHLRSGLLRTADILPPLLTELQAADTPVSAYLDRHLRATTRISLQNWRQGDVPSPLLLSGLCQDLNACLRDGIYTEERFAGIALSGQTRRLLQLDPCRGVDRIDLGRSLLEDTYPEGVARRTGFPDLRGRYAARMEELIRRKTALALQSHRRMGWLTEAFQGGPRQVMQELLSRGMIDIEDPARSPLFGRLEFSGPMYKVFTDEEKTVILEWIESLRPDSAAVIRPEPVAVVDPAQAMWILLMRRGAEAARIAAHAHTELAADGADECRWMGHGPKELMRQLAGTPALVIPGEPAKSPFLEFASSRDMVRDSFSAEEIAVIRRWIEQGAEVPGQSFGGGSSRARRCLVSWTKPRLTKMRRTDRPGASSVGGSAWERCIDEHAFRVLLPYRGPSGSWGAKTEGRVPCQVFSI